MSVPAPHFLLYSEAALACHAVARHAMAGPATDSPATIGRWRFVLRTPGGETSLEAADEEAEASPERLELLAIVRGLEALDQPSRVTLATASPSVQRGLAFGLPEWRASDWHWERYGRMTPVKNSDLWQRLDRLLGIHAVDCRPRRLKRADDLAGPPAYRRGRLVRIDPGQKNRRIKAPKHQTSQHASGSTVLANLGCSVLQFFRS